MAPKLSESDVENYAIGLFESLGYQYVYGPKIGPDAPSSERDSFEQVILPKRLKAALARINPKCSEDLLDDAVKQLQRLSSSELLVNNESFHKMLTEGVKVSYQDAGVTRGDLLWLMDFKSPEVNDFLVVNQFRVKDKRPDLILFINGLPIVVIELKNPADENATLKTAFNQLQTYKQAIPALFTYNGLLIVSDGIEAKSGTISSGINRFMAWKTADGKSEASKLVNQLETMIFGMLNKNTLLDLLRHFIVFEKSKKEDKNTGIITIETIKKIAAYHQYYAVNRAVESTIRASDYIEEHTSLMMTSEDPRNFGLMGVDSQLVGDKKGGVIWHTQGSGKSLSMVFYTGKIVLAMNNPTVLIITDRNDLDDQLFDTFSASRQLLRQEPVQANTREHLKELLKVASGGVVFTTIQKFQPDEGNVYEMLSDRTNIIVIADEAHRTQYGFKAKTVDVKDENHNKIGEKIVYGFAKYMRDALPNATYLGFTGTPIESTDINTKHVFGNYVDIYDIAQAIEDGATVKIYYESRLAKIELSQEGKSLIKEMDERLDKGESDEADKVKTKWGQLEALIGSEARVKQIAKDIVAHFESRQEVLDGKAMVVAMSRRIAAKLYEEIVTLKPHWHHEDLKKGVVKVVMTSASSDGPEISKHSTTKEERRALADRMRDPNDELKLVIVRDMWLTGFDVPALHTLYIDKPMKGHSLMQAIARVNRVYKDKTGGLVVDYLGIASDLKEALAFYSDSGGRGDPAVTQEEAVAAMLTKYEIVSQMFFGYDYKKYFTVDTGKKLSIMLEAQEHILGLEDGKKRYINQTTALSQAFAIAIPHKKAMDIKDEMAFFQTIKSRLVKFERTAAGGSEELETAIRQVIDRAVITNEVVDIYDAAGINKPDISILSDEFLLEVQSMKHKNLAFEVLKKILNDEIRGRTKRNLIQGRSLMELLEASIKKYQNRVLTAAEVIEELISLSKEIKKMDAEPKKLNLTDYEYAFYTAIAHNESAKELMRQEQLRELAVELYQRVKANATIDWTIKESVRASLKVLVKRILRKYGYPPDMQALATETVLKQAELIAQELAEE
jgi:type I restriction enzyme R subunit